jgi:transposase
MSRFPDVKHFVSWLGLSPKNKQSGKMKRRVKSDKGNQAGEIFRLSAQALSASKHNAIGAFVRRLKGRKGPRIAVKAGARKIAVAFYFALTSRECKININFCFIQSVYIFASLQDFQLDYP